MLDSLVVQYLLAQKPQDFMKWFTFHQMLHLPVELYMAVQTGPTSIRVTWTPPSPLGDTTGYRISYTGGGGSSDSVNVDGGNTNSHTLMGLSNGETYIISIVGIASSSGTPRAPVEAGNVALCT